MTDLDTTRTKSYAAMLAKHCPRVLRSDADHADALAVFERLQSSYAESPTPSAGALLELYAVLIEAYEGQPAQERTVAPAQLLAHLLEAREISPARLSDDTGISRGQVSNMLSGARAITRDMAVMLGTYFGVPPSLFLGIE
jgi:HTH-type transcriptional regulator/antitoxin HigA